VWKGSHVLKPHEQQGLQSNKTDPNTSKFNYHSINISMVFTVGD